MKEGRKEGRNEGRKEGMHEWMNAMRAHGIWNDVYANSKASEKRTEQIRF